MRSRAVSIAILVAALGIAAGLLRLFVARGDATAANEREAIARLEALHTLQKLWREGDADADGAKNWWTADWSGFHRALGANGEPVTMMSPSVAAADASPLPNGPRIGEMLPRAPHLGYWYAALPCSKDDYAFGAWPDTWGASGRRTFFTKCDGAIWAKDFGGASRDWPAGDPAASGWSRVR